MAETVSSERNVGRLTIPRSRGATSGVLLILLGLWGALVPFVGPVFDFAYDPDLGSSWTAPRGWLEVLPGVVAIIGGLLLLRTRNRVTAMLGGWLSVIAGAWFVVGRVVATTLTIGVIDAPVADTATKTAWLELTYFYGLGAVIVFLGATALGRLSVRSERDVHYAQAVTAQRDRQVETGSEWTGPIGGPVTGSTPVQPHPSVAGERPRRSWRNPLGRRRDTPTAVAP